jgi:pyrroline-5-carboxylate reductase
MRHYGRSECPRSAGGKVTHREERTVTSKNHLAIIGAGNIGTSIAEGLVESGRLPAGSIALTRRKVGLLDDYKRRGFSVHSSNLEAVRKSDVILLSVEPRQIDGVLREIGAEIRPDAHVVVSVVSGVSIKQIKALIGAKVPVVRAMPNTAIAIRESMTCLAAESSDREAIGIAKSLFDAVGRSLVIDEEQMIAATALGACGIAFFLRAVRAASQGGIEIGLHTDEALLIGAQTARGAASLLLQRSKHPEHEIDLVTTPRGCTIAGLNRMEHEGFSSSMIRGIVTSAEKAAVLYQDKESE